MHTGRWQWGATAGSPAGGTARREGEQATEVLHAEDNRLPRPGVSRNQERVCRAGGSCLRTGLASAPAPVAASAGGASSLCATRQGDRDAYEGSWHAALLIRHASPPYWSDGRGSDPPVRARISPAAHAWNQEKRRSHCGMCRCDHRSGRSLPGRRHVLSRRPRRGYASGRGGCTGGSWQYPPGGSKRAHVRVWVAVCHWALLSCGPAGRGVPALFLKADVCRPSTRGEQASWLQGGAGIWELLVRGNAPGWPAGSAERARTGAVVERSSARRWASGLSLIPGSVLLWYAEQMAQAQRRVLLLSATPAGQEKRSRCYDAGGLRLAFGQGSLRFWQRVFCVPQLNPDVVSAGADALLLLSGCRVQSDRQRCSRCLLNASVLIVLAPSLTASRSLTYAADL